MKAKKLWQEVRAQNALEVLLMLAAAVVIAAVVGLYLKSLPTGTVETKLNTITNQVLENLGQI
jgi:uncharacterized protein (UPF0333 family)